MSIAQHRSATGLQARPRRPAAPGNTPHPALAPLHAAYGVGGAPSDAGHGETAEFWQRYHLEHAWLSVLPGLDGFAATALAVRIAASQPALPAAPPDPGSPLAPFLAGTPDHAAIGPALAALGLFAGPAPGRAGLAGLARAWPVARAVEALLASGGDDRLSLDPASGLNRYGCAPWPRPDVIGFASCTASSLSEAQFLAAEDARRSLIAAALAHGPDAAVAQASADAAARILAHFTVSDLACAILAASGTDAALIVTGLLAAEQPNVPLTSILVSPAETGSGVPDAVQGRHFSTCTPSGQAVPKGGGLDGLRQMPRLVTVALREADGAPRPARALAHACEAAVAAAVPGGRAVLHAIDGSKTGLTAPDRPALLDLARRFGGALDIVIDACQARIEPALVRWYLQHGFPVLVTGSKFFGAPGFCGAVLFPRARLGRIAAGAVPHGLASYAGLSDGIGSRQCAGLFLRWTAALHGMAAFGRLPADAVGARLDVLGQAVGRALQGDARLRLAAAPRPDGMGWSDRRSVFTFLVRGEDGWLDAAGLRPLYLALQDDGGGWAGQAAARCQVGQPVQLGSAALGGLRLALSAAQICEGGDQGEALAAVLGRLGSVLDGGQGRMARAEALPTIRDARPSGWPALGPGACGAVAPALSGPAGRTKD